jgi:protein-L-isoaspartate(D-aspartate) O-methyltransferase
MPKLASYLKEIGVLKGPNLIRAFEKIRRRDFLPAGIKKLADTDTALAIGFGQTNSQPYTVAFMLELLSLRLGQKVLDVGSGSGWQTALLSEIVGTSGEVWALEICPELFEIGQQNLSKYNFKNVHSVLGDGRCDFPKQGEFDRIIIAAASKDIPASLIKQLKEGGRLVMPQGRETCDIIVVEKVRGQAVIVERHPGFVFVPLV